MGITLNNTGAGGSVNITLDKVTSYGLTKKFSYFKRKVPGETSAKTDTATLVVSPSLYDFVGHITTSQKNTLETLKSQPQYTVVYSDNELSNKNCRIENIEFNALSGVESGGGYLPWEVRIRLTGIDH